MGVSYDSSRELKKTISMKNLLLLILFFPFISFTQTLSIGNNQTHTTSGDNSYSDISIGNNGLLHVINPDSIYSLGDITSSNGIGITVDNGAILHADGSLNGNNSIQLNISGKITLGSVNINNNGSLTILGTGELSILGDLTAANGTSIDIDFDGTLDVGGDVTIDASTSTANVNGNFIIGGTYSGPSFTGAGTVTEGGTIIYSLTLPADFLGMNVECINGGYNTVSWKTGSESNTDYFKIERSVNGTDWRHVKDVVAAGNSSSLQTYTVIDSEFEKGVINYYRVSQYDTDGSLNWLKEVAIDNKMTDKVLLRRVNTMGQEVNLNFSGVVFEVYTDGTIIKTIQ